MSTPFGTPAMSQSKSLSGCRQLVVAVLDLQNIPWDQRCITFTLGQQSYPMPRSQQAEDHLRFDVFDCDYLEVTLRDKRDTTRYGICLIPIRRLKRGVAQDIRVPLVEYNRFKGTVQPSLMLELWLQVTAVGFGLESFVRLGSLAITQAQLDDEDSDLRQDIEVRIWRHAVVPPRAGDLPNVADAALNMPCATPSSTSTFSTDESSDTATDTSSEPSDPPGPFHRITAATRLFMATTGRSLPQQLSPRKLARKAPPQDSPREPAGPPPAPTPDAASRPEAVPDRPALVPAPPAKPTRILALPETATPSTVRPANPGTLRRNPVPSALDASSLVVLDSLLGLAPAVPGSASSPSTGDGSGSTAHPPHQGRRGSGQALESPIGPVRAPLPVPPDSSPSRTLSFQRQHSGAVSWQPSTLGRQGSGGEFALALESFRMSDADEPSPMAPRRNSLPDSPAAQAAARAQREASPRGPQPRLSSNSSRENPKAELPPRKPQVRRASYALGSLSPSKTLPRAHRFGTDASGGGRGQAQGQAPDEELPRTRSGPPGGKNEDNAASSSPWKAFLEQQQDDLDKAYDLFVKWKSSVGDVDGAKPPPPPRTNSKTHSGNNVGGFRFHLSNKTAKPKVNVEHPTGLQNSRWIDLDSKQDFNWLPTVHRSRNAPLH